MGAGATAKQLQLVLQALQLSQAAKALAQSVAAAVEKDRKAGVGLPMQVIPDKDEHVGLLRLLVTMPELGMAATIEQEVSGSFDKHVSNARDQATQSRRSSTVPEARSLANVQRTPESGSHAACEDSQSAKGAERSIPAHGSRFSQAGHSDGIASTVAAGSLNGQSGSSLKESGSIGSECIEKKPMRTCKEESLAKKMADKMQADHLAEEGKETQGVKTCDSCIDGSVMRKHTGEIIGEYVLYRFG